MTRLTYSLGNHPALLAAHAALYVEWCDRVGLHKHEAPEIGVSGASTDSLALAEARSGCKPNGKP